MTQENNKTFELFRRARMRSVLPRLYGLLRAGVYRQTAMDNVGLMVAALAAKSENRTSTPRHATARPRSTDCAVGR